MYTFLFVLVSIVSTTYADGEAAAPKGGFDIMSLLPFALIFVVFYFLLIRPQQKKVKQHQSLLASLRRGDRVVTAGGIIGQVDRIINDQEVSVEISEGVKVRFAKQMITDVLSKGTPVETKVTTPSKKEVVAPAKKTTTRSAPKKITKKVAKK